MTEFPSLAGLAHRVRALRRKLYRPPSRSPPRPSRKPTLRRMGRRPIAEQTPARPPQLHPKSIRRRLPLPILHRYLRLPRLLPPPQKRARPQATYGRTYCPGVNPPVSPNPQPTQEMSQKVQKSPSTLKIYSGILSSWNHPPNSPDRGLRRASALGFREAR